MRDKGYASSCERKSKVQEEDHDEGEHGDKEKLNRSYHKKHKVVHKRRPYRYISKRSVHPK